MDEKRLKELGLDEATAKKVLDEIVSDKEKEGWIPKHRFDAVSERMESAESAKKDLEKQISERDAQLETLRKSSADSESLQNQIKVLQDANAKEKELRELADKEHAAEIKTKMREAIDLNLLTAAKARNEIAAKALLNKLDDALDDEAYKAERKKEIDALVAGDETKFMFGEGAAAGLRSRVPGGSGGANPNAENRGALAAERLNQERFPTQE